MINVRTAAFVGLAAAALTAASTASASAGNPADYDAQAAQVCAETGGGVYEKVTFAIQGYPAYVNCVSGPDIRVTPMPAGAYCTILGMPPVVGEADGTGACRQLG
ncbi:hypothetical protein [Nocardia sp. NPDC050406]|uniref:hypothetical protein n=1 Tax=Nocardia sp. NPDC050406 TaxID=3364318 RepID=UPI003791168C